MRKIFKDDDSIEKVVGGIFGLIAFIATNSITIVIKVPAISLIPPVIADLSMLAFPFTTSPSIAK